MSIFYCNFKFIFLGDGIKCITSELQQNSINKKFIKWRVSEQQTKIDSLHSSNKYFLRALLNQTSDLSTSIIEQFQKCTCNIPDLKTFSYDIENRKNAIQELRDRQFFNDHDSFRSVDNEYDSLDSFIDFNINFIKSSNQKLKAKLIQTNKFNKVSVQHFLPYANYQLGIQN